MPRRLTHEEFMEKFYENNKNAENIEILGEYVNNRTKIKCKCKIDGYEWEMTPSNLLSNHGCPKCSGNNKLTHEEFINRIKGVNENIEILGELNSKSILQYEKERTYKKTVKSVFSFLDVWFFLTLYLSKPNQQHNTQFL